MNTNRRIAVVAGVLFIIATLGSVASTALLSPILSAPDYLAKISANESQVLLGAFFQFVGAVACPGIALALYPVLRKHNEGLALGAVGFRLIEGALYVLVVVCLLLLVTLSQESVKVGAPAASAYEVPAVLLMAARDWLGPVAGGADLWPRGSHVLLGALSIATRPPVAVSLGSGGHHAGHGGRPAGHVPCCGSAVDDPGRPGSSHRRARDGLGRLADR